MKKHIGCDLGGTNMRAAIVDVETGTVVHQMSVPTLAREGHDDVMKRMAELCLHVIQSAGMHKDEIGGIGIGVPGVLDLEKGETLLKAGDVLVQRGTNHSWSVRGKQPALVAFILVGAEPLR